MISRSVVGILFLLLTAYSSPSSKNFLVSYVEADDINYRLPTGVEPTKYTIKLIFPDSAFTKDGTEFTGTVVTEFKVASDITEIKFHLADDYITINKLQVNNVVVDKTGYKIDKTTDILSLTITDDMVITKDTIHKMTIEYKGKISNTDTYGIYKSSYTNSEKKTVYLLATQFEPTYARRAFPCFDEPSFKATFDVSVTYPSTNNNLGVLFNTNGNSNPDATGTKTVVFETTPAMSSYLFALIISDFTSTKGENPETDVSYAVWSRDDLKSSRDYAKDIGVQILQKLNEYTGRTYGQDMKKLDQIALPELGAGAMENWGLVTYRERLLLWNSEDSSTNSKQDIATIIAHELAHQWFGNLITCNWWSETFLNEGFATYFEYIIPHQIKSTWELDKQFVISALYQALEADSLEDAQALQSKVSTPLEVNEKFGTISYKKGGSILRMVSYIMGMDKFKAGLQEYVKTSTLQHSTSTPSKLWEILVKHVDAKTSNLPEGVTLTTAMINWVEKSGYPVLTVSLEGKSLKISQERFLLTGEDKSTKWYVPITYIESKVKSQVTNPSKWLTPETPETTLALENENDWVLLNPLQTGYYRVKYETNLLTKIVEALNKENFDGIDVLNRAQLVDDSFSLAKAGKLSYSDVLKVIQFLKSDTSYYSWVPALKGFTYMMQRIQEGSELKTKLKEQLLTLISTIYKSVSFEEVKDDDQIYTFKQVLAISWACLLEEQSCISNVKKAFSEYKEKGTKPNKNLKSVVYCNALRNSDGVSEYEFLWEQYTKTEDSTEKNTILNSLGCSNNEEKLKELLTETIKGESSIRLQDSLTAFAAVYGGSQKGAEVALNFLADKLSDILKKLTTTSAQKSLITGIAGKLTTDAQVQKFKSLIESNTFPSDLKEVATKSLTEAQSNLKWIAEHQKDLNAFYGIDDNPGGNGAFTNHTNVALLALVSIFSLVGFLFK